MIRLIFDKVRVSNTLGSLRNLPNVIKSSFTHPKRNLSEIARNNGEEFSKDIILFKYENPKKFLYLNFFAISQVFFWGYLGNWSYTEMRDSKIVNVDEDLPWWKRVNLGEKKYKNTLAATCFVLGYLVLLCGWTYTLRSVRYLILKKDGKTLTFVTYTPFGRNRMMDVPLRCVSAEESRGTAKVYLPLKVQNRYLFYILDMGGEFRNTRIFDTVVALKRKFKEK